jgi:DNA topoisomerase VI subunit B
MQLKQAQIIFHCVFSFYLSSNQLLKKIIIFVHLTSFCFQANRVFESRQNLSSTSKQLKEVETALAAACKKLGIEVSPSDRLSAQRKSKRKMFALLLTSAVLMSSIGVVYAASKMFVKN